MSRNRLWQWFKRIYALIVVTALTLAVVAAWPVLRQWQPSQILPGATGVIAGWIGMVILLGHGWAGSLRAWSGVSLHLQQWLPMQAAAWVGRYLPGKVGLLAGKLQACEHGANWKQVTGSVLSEQIAFIASGLALSALALPCWLPLLPEVVASHPRHELVGTLLLPSLIGIALGIWATGKHLPLAGKQWSMRLLLWATLAHLVAGAGFHALLANVLAAPPNLATSIGLLAAAHTAGVLAIFAPAGLGVREAVIMAALAPQLGLTQAVAITALQRALVVIGDACIASFALAVARKRSVNQDD